MHVPVQCVASTARAQLLPNVDSTNKCLFGSVRPRACACGYCCAFSTIWCTVWCRLAWHCPHVVLQPDAWLLSRMNSSCCCTFSMFCSIVWCRFSVTLSTRITTWRVTVVQGEFKLLAGFVSVQHSSASSAVDDFSVNSSQGEHNSHRGHINIVHTMQTDSHRRKNVSIVGCVARLCRSWISSGESGPNFSWGKFPIRTIKYSKYKRKTHKRRNRI